MVVLLLVAVLVVVAAALWQAGHWLGERRQVRRRRREIADLEQLYEAPDD